MKKMLLILMSIACVCDSYATLLSKNGRCIAGSSTVVGSVYAGRDKKLEAGHNDDCQQVQKVHTSYQASNIVYRDDCANYSGNDSVYQETSKQNHHDINDAYSECANVSDGDCDCMAANTHVNQGNNGASVGKSLEYNQFTEHMPRNNDEYMNYDVESSEHHEMPRVHDHEQSFMSTRATFSTLAGGIATIGAAVGVYCWLHPEDAARYSAEMCDTVGEMGISVRDVLWGTPVHALGMPAYHRVADIVTSTFTSQVCTVSEDQAPCDTALPLYGSFLDALSYLQG